MREDPDAHCTRKMIIWAKAEGESTIRGFRSQENHKLRHTDQEVSRAIITGRLTNRDL